MNHAPAVASVPPWWPEAPGPDSEVVDRLLWYPSVARYAPSKHNSQPWRFVVRGSTLEVWTDPVRALPESDPVLREVTLSCGAALHHIEVAARALGRRLRVDLLPEGGSSLLARVTEVGEVISTPRDQALLAAVPHRHTDRGPLDRSLLPASLPFQLQSVAAVLGASFRLVASAGDRATLADLVARADRLLARQGAVDRELERWLREPSDHRDDGVPRDRTRGAAASYRAEFVQRDFSGTESNRYGLAAHDRDGIDHPLLGVLCTNADRPHDWVTAGRALSAVLLEATAAGAQASNHNQPVEVSALRAELRTALCLPGEAQLVLRLGAGAPVARTPRRPVEDMRFQA